MYRSVVIDTSQSPHARLKPVPVQAVTLHDGFWKPRIQANHRAGIPEQFQILAGRGALENFRRLYSASAADSEGFVYRDSDLYKWMEAAAFALGYPDTGHIAPLLEACITAILPAQGADGYLNSFFGNDPANRFHNIASDHELYCAGHFIQAALAHARTSDDDRLLAAARRFADYLAGEFHAGGRTEPPGHPEIELALVELYRATGDARYLDLARFFLEQIGLVDFQQFEGHAVRAAYCAAGAADYYLESGDEAYLESLERQWADMVGTKLYITGGIGGRYRGESLGTAYELPNQRAYAETCGALAVIFWAWRMAQIGGEARFTDVLERALYNGALAGVSLDGRAYFYVNPLADHGRAEGDPWYPWARRAPYQRQPAYACNCCPPNVERFLSSLPGYMASTSEDGVWLHLYDAAQVAWQLPDGTPFTLTIETRYPWEGHVRVQVGVASAAEFTLYLRVPGWGAGAQLAVNGDAPDALPTGGAYAAVRRTWQAGDTVDLWLPMEPRLMASDPRVAENRGSVAVQRGPVVYCLEGVDHDGVDVRQMRIDPGAPLAEQFDAGTLGGLVTVTAHGSYPADAAPPPALYHPLERATDNGDRGRHAAALRFVPYYAWANRGATSMSVWVPLAD